MNLGWVKLHRQAKDSIVFKKPTYWMFWSWCLMTAAYKPTKVVVGYKEVTLQPGQILFGRPGRRLASEETGLSDFVLRTIVKKLSSGDNPCLHETSEKSTQGYSILTVINWDTYQNELSPVNTEPTQSQHSANTPPTHNPHVSNTQPTHDQHRENPELSQQAPCACAPARVKEEEVKEVKKTTHCHAGVDDSEIQTTTTYQLALALYREESGVAACDFNAKEGARIAAQAIDDGELDASLLRAVIKNGLADDKLPNQGYRGIARNFSKYLPKQGASESATKARPPIVTFVCGECGHLHREYWTIPREPVAIACTADNGCRGRMMPHVPSARASPGEENTGSRGVGVA